MKKVGIILGILILIGCVTGLILTYSALGATQDQLDETKTALNEMQIEQQDTVRVLDETRNDLTATADSLQETRQTLEEQKNETEKYTALYETSADELEETQTRLDEVEDKLDQSEKEKLELQKMMEEVQEKLALYEDTLGTQVFADVLPPYNTGYLADLALTNNITANNPTWKELLDFLSEDRTDKKLYVVDVYMCGSFAQELHNNAEAQGIRAAFVAIHFYNEVPHAINAFKTTDRGLVYIDATGTIKPSPISRLDTQVEVVKDEIYQGTFLFPEGYIILEGDEIVKSIEIYW